MKILFFGLGSIGTRHARLIKQLYPYELYAFRSGNNKNGNSLGLKEIHDWKDVDALNPDVAFITNPTHLHLTTSLLCAQRGMALFIEKPLGSNITGLMTLSKFCKHKKLITYVAYVLRFHPVVDYLMNAVRKHTFLHMRMITTSYLPSWRPGNNHLKKYSAYRNMGGGVINDLSHELDSAQFILGSIQKIKGQFDRRSALTVDSEDYADILLETKSGPVNIHINYFSQKKQRLIQIDFKEKMVVGDILRSTIKEYKDNKLVKQIKFKGGYAKCFQKQLRYFFDNIENPNMMNNVVQATPLLKKILELKREGGRS